MEKGNKMPNNTSKRKYKLPKLRDADKSIKIGTTTADNPGNCATQMATKRRGGGEDRGNGVDF